MQALLRLLCLTAGLLCCSIGEERGAVEGLLLLWRRLNAELQRMQASPAAALLDQVLRAIDPASGLVLRDRQQVFLLLWVVLCAVQARLPAIIMSHMAAYQAALLTCPVAAWLQ